MRTSEIKCYFISFLHATYHNRLSGLRELLLIEGIALQGLGNWQAVSEHVGTRSKEEVEEHYYNVYINSPHWPMPVNSSVTLLKLIPEQDILVIENGLDLRR